MGCYTPNPGLLTNCSLLLPGLLRSLSTRGEEPSETLQRQVQEAEVGVGGTATERQCWVLGPAGAGQMEGHPDRAGTAGKPGFLQGLYQS